MPSARAPGRTILVPQEPFDPMSPETPFDLDRYLERIGYGASAEPRLPTLEALHAAHLDRIPFENVDVRLGREIALDLDALQAKLVRRRRGGYCFEHNGLFAAALQRLGFAVSTLEARVRPPGVTEPLPRTHMVLAVEADGRRWLADVGFGGDGPGLPVPIDGELSDQAEAAYRVERENDGLFVLRRRWRGSWADLYAFSLVPALPVDFAVANHYTSTHPSSIFVRRLTVQRSAPAARHILRGRSYLVRRGEEERRHEVSDSQLPGLLAERFGLELTEEETQRLVELTREEVSTAPSEGATARSSGVETGR